MADDPRELTPDRYVGLNRLADLFGLAFRYRARRKITEVFVQFDRLMLPRDYNGEP